MSVQFKNLTAYGTHGPVVTEPPARQRRIVKYWGLHGEREIDGGRGGRMLRIEITVHNRYASRQSLQLALDLADRIVGHYGTLAVRLADGTTKQYQHCTFEGFQPHGDPRGRTGPLKDEAGTLDGGWWIQGTLHFRQLSVET